MNIQFYIYLFYLPFLHAFLLRSHHSYQKWLAHNSNINQYDDYQRFLHPNISKNDSINNIFDLHQYLKK